MYGQQVLFDNAPLCNFTNTGRDEYWVTRVYSAAFDHTMLTKFDKTSLVSYPTLFFAAAGDDNQFAKYYAELE